jgi:hypothetical protein
MNVEILMNQQLAACMHSFFSLLWLVGRAEEREG